MSFLPLGIANLLLIIILCQTAASNNFLDLFQEHFHKPNITFHNEYVSFLKNMPVFTHFLRLFLLQYLNSDKALS